MADNNNTNVDIPFSEGRQSIKLPEYAMESTQQAILEQLKKQTKGDSGQNATLEELLDATVRANRRNQENAAEADRDRDRQLDLLRQISESESKFDFGQMGSSLLKFTGAIIAAGFSAAVALKNLTKETGYNVRNLADVGVGFEEVGGETGVLIANMQRLGLSTENAMSVLTEYSNVVQGLGKQAFISFQTEFLRASQQGAMFGLSLAESTKVLAEDLELRQQLGFMDRINAITAADQSKELYKQQLNATKLLGVSIDSIRSSGQDFIDNNAQASLSIMEMSKRFDGDVAGEFLNTIQSVRGSLTALKVDPQLANQLVNELTDVQAFISENGGELYRTLTGSGAGDIATSIRDINDALRSGDEAAVKAAMQDMNKLPKQLSDFAANLSAKEIRTLKNRLMELGTMGESLALSLGNLADANKRFEKEAKYPEISKGITAFDNAVDLLQGTFGSMRTEIGAIVGESLGEFAEVLTENNGVMDVFRDSVKRVRDALMYSFLGMSKETDNASKKTNAFSSLMSNKVIPFITDSVDGLVEWIEGLGGPEQLWEDTEKSFNSFMESVSLLDEAIKKTAGFFGWFIGTEEVVQTDKDGNPIKDKEGNVKTQLEFDLTETLVKVFGAALVLKAASSLFAAALSASFTTLSAGAAAGTASIGTGLGTAMSGMAVGLGALASPKALVGLTALTASINGIAYAFSVASEGFDDFGKMMASVMKETGPLLESFGKSIRDVFEGLGGFVESIGNTIGRVIGDITDSITKYKQISADIESSKIESQTAAMQRLSEISPDSIISTSGAVNKLSDAMERFGEVLGSEGLISDSGLDVDKLTKVTDALSSLDSTKIYTTALAITSMADAYARFADIDSTALENNISQLSKIPQDVQMPVVIMGGNTGVFSQTQESANPPTPVTQTAGTTTTETTSEAVTAEYRIPKHDIERNALLLELITLAKQQASETVKLHTTMKDLKQKV